jgi:hypothetical protein
MRRYLQPAIDQHYNQHQATTETPTRQQIWRLVLRVSVIVARAFAGFSTVPLGQLNVELALLLTFVSVHVPCKTDNNTAVSSTVAGSYAAAILHSGVNNIPLTASSVC